MFLWNYVTFLMIQGILAIWSLVPLPFLNPSGSSQFMYCWSLAWRILSITLHVRWVQLCGSLSILWHCLVWDWNESWPFLVCGHCWVFQICWHIVCSTFTASSFRIWSSSAKIPSSPLALLTVMLPKAHLTSHSRMSGSRWVITLSWLSGSLRSFLYKLPNLLQMSLMGQSLLLRINTIANILHNTANAIAYIYMVPTLKLFFNHYFICTWKFK